MVHGVCVGWWKVLEMESGDGLHKSVNILNAIELHTSKWLKRQSLCLCYHNENKNQGCFFEHQKGLQYGLQFENLLENEIKIHVKVTKESV